MGIAVAVPLPDSTEKPSFLQVTYTTPNLSVNAQKVLLGNLLRAIGEEAGFKFRGPEKTRIIDRVSIREEPLIKVIEQLLAGEDYLIQYQPGGPNHNIVAVVLADESARDPVNMKRQGLAPSEHSGSSISRENQLLESQSLIAGRPERDVPDPTGVIPNPREESGSDPFATSNLPGNPSEAPQASSVNQPAQVPLALQQRTMQDVQKLAEGLKRVTEDLK